MPLRGQVIDEAAPMGVARLVRCSDESGAMETAEVAKGELRREMLLTEDVFLLDNEAEIFVWVGKGANADERKAGLSVGTDYAAANGRPPHTRVTKVMEGAEPPTFKLNFASWAAQPGPVADLGAGRFSVGSPNIATSPRQRSSSEVASRRLEPTCLSSPSPPSLSPCDLRREACLRRALPPSPSLLGSPAPLHGTS
jgi:hypothetical protein